MQVIHSLNNQCDLILDSRPIRSEQNNNAEVPTYQVLLIAKILVSGDEGIKPFCLSASQQIAVADVAPPSFIGRLYDMILQVIPQRDGSPLIKQ